MGVTTGRKRRCGWLDLVLLKYTNMINGFTALCLTKLDTLDELAEIKVATTYKRNGVELPSFPGRKIQINIFFISCLIASVDTMHDIEVEYVTFPGWRGRSTSECRTFNSLPHNARLYIQFIEQYLGVPGLYYFFLLST
jgi:adenylosuccinate synthase